ncbi:ISSoc13, transposase orfA [Gloeomargarita lithophora Alchichica-D10]|uniref:ISSoc13, transposase orfA n=1 Tax=Gloeomargarita lithophora Alchichica-D10 TaxID=1188229 RepID=A0A1J0AEY0_9CYAN|nr:hypothetical protein [Gloeomargarita lithophora]APB34472.1 ISSoc13, transposase orfA [Gloeomargarita lithophora Alchichica-D10]
MSFVFLDENRWQKILGFLQTEDRVNIGKEAGCKQFIEAVLWMALVLLGVICRKHMANGLQFIKDFIGGVVLGCGNGCSSILLKTLI